MKALAGVDSFQKSGWVEEETDGRDRGGCRVKGRFGVSNTFLIEKDNFSILSK